ncbi:GH92 family glycosyl hydrolase [Frigoribacterium sp. JB110]|uniref:GH92 family glycosyl hydrolase n=1 Tax=Microbacterium sp. TaxID=51671 RepID=UPI00097E8A9C|nr:Alpha-1,2-mannosidase [Frigoribacterium sp. JB110]
MHTQAAEQRPSNGLRGALRTAVAVAAALVVAAPALAAAPATAAPAAEDLTGYVNPFIGTQDDGNTYPGASVPFGMVQFSPDNGHNVGYDYGNSRIRGFSLVHLSGVGCGLGGLMPVLPTTGVPDETRYEDYALGYSHDDEDAAPGYYRVGLQAPAGTIDAELTATEHTAVQRYTFPETSEATVLINAGQALNSVTDSSVRIVDDRTVETTITSRGFCQDTQPFTVHTLTTFDRDIASSGTWDGDEVSADARSADGERTGAYVTFDATTDRDVEAVTSLSYVDAEGARANHDAEVAAFDDAHDAAAAAWQERLASVQVPTTDEEQARVFYSALYRSFLAPNTGTDVDGRYRGWDGDVHSADGFTYYQNFSLWDTYRTQQQLLYLLAPEESRDMAISVVTAGEQLGWLPRWGYGPVETNIMTGDPGTAFLVSAWNQGLLEGYEERAYAVLAHNADNQPDETSVANGRAGNDVYLEDGYVPHEPSENGRPGDYDLHHGGSATLEYALSDALLSTMAAGLGHDADAQRYAVRGENYRAIFDRTTESFRARDRSGFFIGDPDPAQATGFHEGTAVQYQWLVPQDVPGLIDMLGGADATEERLDEFFAFAQLQEDPEGTARDVWVNGTYSYYGQHTYNPNNEPDLHAPYLYQWTGQPWKTTDVVRAALTLFTDGPTGVTGNDDLGTMSAWYVLSAVGAYPIVPGTDVWGLSTPAFESVDIALDEDWFGTDALHIRAPGLTDENRYTQSVTASSGLGAVERSHLTGDELVGAGTLTFDVGSEPSDWATADGSTPDAIVSAGEVPSRLTARVSPGHAAVEAGGSTEVSVEVLAQAEGEAGGTVRVDGGDDVVASAGGESWSLDSDGFPVSEDIPLSLSVRPGVIAGTYPVTVTVADDAGTEIELSTSVTVGDDAWLADAFDDVGIGDAREGNADFDGGGAYLLRDALTDLGFVQGAAGAVPGTDATFVVPAVEAGEPDNVRADGQELEVPDAFRRSTSLSLVGATNNGSPHAGGALTLQYTDGTQSETQVELSDWCTGDPAEGNVVVAKAGQRGNGTGDPQNIGCGLYATAPIAVPDGKTLESITLPEAQNMHVFTVAFETPNPVTPELAAEASDEEPAEGDDVAVTVRADPSAAEGEIVVTVAEDGDERAAAAADGADRITAPMTDGVAGFSVTATAEAVRYRVEFVPADGTLFSPASLEDGITVQAAPGSGDDGDDQGDGDGDGDADDDGQDDDDGDDGGQGDDGQGDDGRDGDAQDGDGQADDDQGAGDGAAAAVDASDDALAVTGGGVSLAVLAVLAAGLVALAAGAALRLRGRRRTEAGR